MQRFGWILALAFAAPACAFDGTNAAEREARDDEALVNAPPVGVNDPWWRYVVSIPNGEQDSDGSQVTCTGVIVSATQVLSAAHCLPDNPSSPITVNFERGTMLDGGDSQRRVVGEKTLPGVDIVLYTLDKPIPAGYVAASLPSAPDFLSYVADDSLGVAIGAGKHDGNKDLAGQLRMRSAIILSRSDTDGTFLARGADTALPDFTNLGDSGGPLFKWDVPGKPPMALGTLAKGAPLVGATYVSLAAPTTWTWLKQNVQPRVDVEIAWRRDDGAVAMWPMNGAAIDTDGSGRPLDRQIDVVSDDWTIAGTADFDGDVIADVLWFNLRTFDVEIWLMSGVDKKRDAQGNYLQRVVGTAPPGWTMNAAGDFDGDGHADILWRRDSGEWSIWFMNGFTLSQSTPAQPRDPSWQVQGTGRFNATAGESILWRNGAGDVEMWSPNVSGAKGSFAVHTVRNGVPSSWVVIGTGDFDGDRRTDILWQHTGATDVAGQLGDLAMWKMSGSTIVAEPNFRNLNPRWHLEAKGDLDFDGRTDLVWRDDLATGISTGDVRVWLMNGTATTAETTVRAGVPLEWEIQGQP